MFPAYVSPFIPVAVPFWPGSGPGPQPAATAKAESHEVLKPTAVHSKSPINVDELVGLSKLSLQVLFVLVFYIFFNQFGGEETEAP